MSIYLIPSIIAFFGTLTTFILVLKSNRKKKANYMFAVTLIPLLLMAGGASPYFFLNDAGVALLFSKIGGLGAVLVYAPFYHFSEVTLAKGGKIRNPFAVYLAYISCLFFIFMLPTDLLMSSVRKYYWGFYPTAGPMFPIYGIITYIFVSLGIRNFVNVYKKSESLYRKQQSKYYLFGIVIASLGGTTVFLPMYGLPVFPLMDLSFFVMAIFCGYGILRYQLFDIEVFLRNAIIRVCNVTFLFLIGIILFIGISSLLTDSTSIIISLLVITIFVLLVYEDTKKTVIKIVEIATPKLKWKECVLQEVFLLNRSGIVVAYYAKKEKGLDKDVVGGMLEAVQSFVRESLSVEERETLKSIAGGRTKMLIEHTEFLTMTVIFTGFETGELRNDAKKILTVIEREHLNLIKEWNGTIEALKPIQTMLENFFK